MHRIIKYILQTPKIKLGTNQQNALRNSKRITSLHILLANKNHPQTGVAFK